MQQDNEPKYSDNTTKEFISGISGMFYTGQVIQKTLT